MIIYNRDKEGNIDKNSQTYIVSKNKVNNLIQEFLESSDMQINLKKMGDQIEVNVSNILTNMLATTEVFELVLTLLPSVKNLKGGDKMVELYVTLILEGAKTIDDVPVVIKPQVIEQLKLIGVEVKEGI